MKHYKDLTEKEKEPLLKFPAYVSLLNSTAINGIDKEEKKTAIKITRIKTYSSVPALVGFYKDAAEIFEDTITALDGNLPKGRNERKIAIQNEVDKLELLLHGLDPEFVNALRQSMNSYHLYIPKAHENFLEYFIFPMTFTGISDQDQLRLIPNE